MTDLLQTASDWLADQFKTHASKGVTYRRRAQGVSVLATIGRTVFQIDDGSGVLLRIELRDYLIQATDLVLGGLPTLPQRGDRIEETQGGTVYAYEVVGPGGEPHWRFSDPYRKTLRIHTKLAGTTLVP